MITMKRRSQEIAEQLCKADQRAILSKPGSGNYSTVCFRRLKDNLLVDDNFWLTDLGWEVRMELGGSSTP